MKGKISKLAWLVVAIFISTGVISAQVRTDTTYIDENGDLVKVYKPVTEELVPDSISHNEISIGYGIMPTTEWFKSMQNKFDYTFAGTKTKRGHSGSFSVSYLRCVYKNVFVGILLSYNGFKTSIVGANMGEHLTDIYYRNISVMAGVKYNWLNTRIISLYSTIFIGGDFEHAKWKNTNPAFGQVDVVPDGCAVWQVSPIGIEIGKSIKGFAEAGFGQVGFACAGIRFRF
jgi:hypothetical protein